jgi:peptide chain release factor 1
MAVDLKTERERLERRNEELSSLLSTPEVLSDHARLAELSREHAEVRSGLELIRDYARFSSSLEESEELLRDESDPELRRLAEQERAQSAEEIKRLGQQLEERFHPADPNDKKSAIIEIRAGSGGEEAALFAAQLYRMYDRYALSRGWRGELISLSETGSGGMKEVIFEVAGPGAYGALKYEAGVHRVQRVPETESSGRIHTSAASVAVLPEAEEHEVEIKDSDLRVDVFRSGGHGGQSVNTTDSAVRLTHLPTGIVVTCQDEKSQLKNKLKALGVLRSRLLALEEERRSTELGEARRSLIGSGDRSEKIRTYNFPQDRLTDHRIGFSAHGLSKILDGELGPLLQALRAAERESRAGS